MKAYPFTLMVVLLTVSTGATQKLHLDRIKQFGQEITQISKIDLINGLGITLLTKGSILFSKGYGYANRDKEIDGKDLNLPLIKAQSEEFHTPEDKVSMKGYLKNFLSPQGDWYSKKNFLRKRPAIIGEIVFKYNDECHMTDLFHFVQNDSFKKDSLTIVSGATFDVGLAY
ncbi:MAG: hypothetical protein AAF693_08615 [Bacteroidota bacterium]